ncbi:hypothetical protein CTAYLR_004132 [Chrysophaeum taylorii]|uniref:Uncharacterized protein n=1 Tax=Chrysophaeum taylorii TaxID=2483200 RepID=A0AAD7UL64_9STRA|nr:hypothetical protein CTAYLR_004132 [Chrysophaeum taylorii]
MSLPVRVGDSAPLKPHGGSRLKKKFTTPAPGDYDVGTKHDIKYSRSPVSQFGGNLCKIDRDKTGLRSTALQRADDPGPHNYNAAAAKQKLDTKMRAHAIKFGSSNRETSSKIYVHRHDTSGDATDPNRQAAGRSVPGPGAYDTVDSSIIEKTKRAAPSFSFGLKTPSVEGYTTAQNIGPGTYHQPSSLGTQVLSKKPTTPGFSMGASDRNKMSEVLSPGFSPKVKSQSPGPSHYESPSGIGKQPVSTRATATGYSFGSEQKLKRPRDTGVPGPAKYDATSMLGIQPYSKHRTYGGFKFGTSQRPDTADQVAFSSSSSQVIGGDGE